MLGALLVHVAIIALLILVTFAVPQPDESSSGLSVAMGNVEMSQGFSDPSLVDVDILPEEPVEETEAPLPDTSEPEDMITQTEEETVAISPEEKKKREEELQRELEKKKIEEAAEAARRRVSSAFGKGAKMEASKGSSSSGKGVEGNPEGNALSGSTAGTGHDPVFDLGGRSLRKGTSLPLPVYNVQEEGRVVVDVTVNPSGAVIATAINPRTTTVNTALRKAAEDAAKKALFEEVAGVTNQRGTITYYFNLK